DDRFDLHAIALLGLRPRPGKKVEQAGAVPTLNPMPGKLLAARTVDRHNPFRFAQFERGEQSDIIRAGGGRDSGRRGDRLHRLPPCWWWKLSLPSPAAVHPHRIFFRALHALTVDHTGGRAGSSARRLPTLHI